MKNLRIILLMVVVFCVCTMVSNNRYVGEKIIPPSNVDLKIPPLPYSTFSDISYRPFGVSLVERDRHSRFIELYVTTDELNKRNLPSQKSSIKGRLYRGDLIVGHISDINISWYVLDDGTYVDARFVQEKKLITASRGMEHIRTRLDKVSNLDITNIEVLIKNTGFKNDGKSILQCESSFNVNALFIIAVAKHESGNGYSNLARTKNNLFGFNAFGNVSKNATYFETKAESIHQFSNLIRTSYFNKGKTTLESIAHIYCESSDEWVSGIKTIMAEDMRTLWR